MVIVIDTTGAIGIGSGALVAFRDLILQTDEAALRIKLPVRSDADESTCLAAIRRIAGRQAAFESLERRLDLAEARSRFCFTRSASA